MKLLYEQNIKTEKSTYSYFKLFKKATSYRTNLTLQGYTQDFVQWGGGGNKYFFFPGKTPRNHRL